MRTFFIIGLLAIGNTIYSQNTSTITITSEQLRTATLIFAEHQKLSETVPLLEHKITNLTLINESWERTDSINKIRLSRCWDLIEDNKRSIDGLNKSLKRKQNVIKYGAASSCVLIFLCLLLK